MSEVAHRSHRLAPHEREAMRGLVDKYERMRSLRAELGHGEVSPVERTRLRALASDFPGSLRELETLTTAEIDRRHALTSTIEHDAPAWLIWTAAYHQEMRVALHARISGSREELPHGRLNVLVFDALGKRFGVEPSLVWDTLFPRRGSAARSYRS